MRSRDKLTKRCSSLKVGNLATNQWIPQWTTRWLTQEPSPPHPPAATTNPLKRFLSPKPSSTLEKSFHWMLLRPCLVSTPRPPKPQLESRAIRTFTGALSKPKHISATQTLIIQKLTPWSTRRGRAVKAPIACQLLRLKMSPIGYIITHNPRSRCKRGNQGLLFKDNHLIRALKRRSLLPNMLLKTI